MSFKVVRNTQGHVTGYGPNDDNYEPGQPYTVEDAEPTLWVDPKDAIRARIDNLERQQLMPRATREFMLMFMEANATPDILAANPGYQAVKAFDNEIKALGAQL